MKELTMLLKSNKLRVCRYFSMCTINLHYKKSNIVLGIESSCDDTAVAIVSSDRIVRASRTITDKSAQRQMGGIAPYVSATVGRMNIDRLVDECLDISGLRYSDLDAIAVTTTPGQVLSLKVGIEKALSLARRYYLDLIPVNHMRAHAIVSRLIDPSIEYPFLCLLISGGHSIIALVENPEKFYILGESQGSSPGGCLDRIARELGLQLKTHYAASLEETALNSSSNGYLRFFKLLPKHSRADFNFTEIKSYFLNIIYKGIKAEELPDLCASAQFVVTAHLCKSLNVAFEYVKREQLLNTKKTLVVSGGVAANKYIKNSINKLSDFYGFDTCFPPPRLCSDNAEMIAMLGLELLDINSSSIIKAANVPVDSNISVRAVSKSPVGVDIRNKLPEKPNKRLRIWSLHGSGMLVIDDKSDETKTNVSKISDNYSQAFESIRET